MTTTKTAKSKKAIPTKLTLAPGVALRDMTLTPGDLYPNTEGPALRFVALDAIVALPQVRTEFDDATLQELADDIKLRGMLQPVLLRPVSEGNVNRPGSDFNTPNHNDAQEKYFVIAGERRVRAARLAGLAAVPAIVGEATAEQADEMQLAENIQREELTLSDTARAVRKLYDREGSLAKVAAIVHKSKPWVCKHLAVTEPDFSWRAKELLVDGHTEDLELLTIVSTIDMLNWTAGRDISEAVIAGKCGRAEARKILVDLKASIAQAKQEEAVAKSNAKAESIAVPAVKKEPVQPVFMPLRALWDIHNALHKEDSDIAEILAPYSEAQRIDILGNGGVDPTGLCRAFTHGFLCKDMSQAELLRRVAAILATDESMDDTAMAAFTVGATGKPFTLENVALEMQLAFHS
jgi:hypothetical protein